MSNLARLLSVFLLVISILGGVVLAANRYDIPWHVMSGGGGTSSGGDYMINATIGQAVAATSRGNDYQACIGYWCGNVPGWHLYLPKMLMARGE